MTGQCQGHQVKYNMVEIALTQEYDSPMFNRLKDIGKYNVLPMTERQADGQTGRAKRIYTLN